MFSQTSKIPYKRKTIITGVAAALIVNLLMGKAIAQSTSPGPIHPNEFEWFSPPGISTLQGAWILGADQTPGTYVLRVKLKAGGRIPPHTHPDERISTVLSGVIYVGFGETFDESNVVAIRTGAVYVAPANVPHYVWAKDGDAEYQENGVGPTTTTFIGQ